MRPLAQGARAVAGEGRREERAAPAAAQAARRAALHRSEAEGSKQRDGRAGERAQRAPYSGGDRRGAKRGTSKTTSREVAAAERPKRESKRHDRAAARASRSAREARERGQLGARGATSEQKRPEEALCERVKKERASMCGGQRASKSDRRKLFASECGKTY